MGTIKAKNANGEWENVAVANHVNCNCVGSVKYKIINAATDFTFDLSPYVKPGADFILIFYAYSVTGNALGDAYVWENRLGELKHKSDSSSCGLTTSIYDNTDIDKSNWINASYDTDNCILTVSKHPQGTSVPYLEQGYLYYAG
jgi:hypothetical protein